jgi:serine/threonine protein kinase
MSEGTVDPQAETLAVAADSAELAARTLTDPNRAPGRSSSSDDLGGEFFAHFRLERRIGRGGMGEVYLATDVALDRSVALKVLGREISDDSAARDRFVREARAQARINHPNICHIYFIGEQHGRLFFAMELVEGENLAQRGRADADGGSGPRRSTRARVHAP